MEDSADGDEPFLIKELEQSTYSSRRIQGGGDGSNAENTTAATEPKFKHGNNLRRRFRRRSDEEAKDGDDEKVNDSKPASKDAVPPIPRRPSSRSRFNQTMSAEEPTSANKPARLSMPIMHSQSSYIRRGPDEKLKEKFDTKLRGVVDEMPEIHFIGEVIEGAGFNDTFVSCKWHLEWGRAWSFLEGDESSQTQYASSDDGVQVWNHPIDVHFASASIQGWPRMVMQVWELDEYGRSILAGYGFAHMPTNPGYHELEVHCWRPSGSFKDELQYFFLGTSSCLVDEEAIFNKAWDKRSQIKTVSSGIVKLRVTVLLRFFNEQNVG